MSVSPPSDPLSERFGLVFNALMDAVKRRRMAGCLVLAVVGIQLWVRIQRLRNRVVRLVERMEKGTFRAWVLRRAGGRAREMRPEDRQRLADVSRLWKGVPRGFGWLLPLVPSDAAICGAQFEGLLRDPEMRRALMACPGLGRMLRPFCKMLGVDAALLVAVEGEVIAPAAVVVARAVVPGPVVRILGDGDPAAVFVPFWQRLSWS